MKKFSVACYNREEFNDAQNMLLKKGYKWNGSRTNEKFDLYAFNSYPNYPIMINCGYSSDSCLTFDDDFEQTKMKDATGFYDKYDIIKYSVLSRKDKLKKLNENWG